MNAGRFSIREKLGLPPMFIGQSEIMKYHIPSSARVVPVVAYMNAAMPKRVRFTPMMGSMPWTGKGEKTSFTRIPFATNADAASFNVSSSSYITWNTLFMAVRVSG